ncbi:SH3 and PX domain-containing protein 2B [Irineochytrium annulatum]|nr:SH3 and PX domain-containing protein 2B [Irineochytrium annulatum]
MEFMDLSIKVMRYEKRDRRFYFVCDVRVDGSNGVIYRTYDDFYRLQITLLDTFETKGGTRIIPYLPGPKIFPTDSITRRRVPALNDYCQDLTHLDARIALSRPVLEFVKEREYDRKWNDGLLEKTKGGSKGLAPWLNGIRGRSAEAVDEGAQGSRTQLKGGERVMRSEVALSKGKAQQALERVTKSDETLAGRKIQQKEKDADTIVVRIADSAVQLDVNRKVTLQDLTRLIASNVNGANGKQIYIDDEGDSILVDDDEALSYCLETGAVQVFELK